MSRNTIGILSILSRISFVRSFPAPISVHPSSMLPQLKIVSARRPIFLFWIGFIDDNKRFWLTLVPFTLLDNSVLSAIAKNINLMYLFCYLSVYSYINDWLTLLQRYWCLGKCLKENQIQRTIDQIPSSRQYEMSPSSRTSLKLSPLSLQNQTFNNSFFGSSMSIFLEYL